MPTGYTSELDETPNITTAQWIMENLTRAFGVCVTLRDNGDMTEEQIESHLRERVEGDGSYYMDALKKTQEEFKRLRYDPTYWDVEYASTVERLEKYNKESIEEANALKIKHYKAIEDLIILRECTTDETTKNIAQFGLDQLELVKSDTEPYIQEIPSFEKFKKDKYNSICKDLEYYAKNLKEEKEREQSRLEAYLKIKSEVKRVLGSNSLSQTIIEGDE